MSVYFLSNLARIVSFSFDGTRYVHQSFQQKGMKGNDIIDRFLFLLN